MSFKNPQGAEPAEKKPKKEKKRPAETAAAAGEVSGEGTPAAKKPKKAKKPAAAVAAGEEGAAAKKGRKKGTKKDKNAPKKVCCGASEPQCLRVVCEGSSAKRRYISGLGILKLSSAPG